MARQAQKTKPKSKTTKAKQATTEKGDTASATKVVQAASTTQLLNQRQSQDLTQTLVLCAFGIIAYLREFFPERCFDERALDVSNDIWTYEDFASGNVSSTNQDRQRFKILRRGSHQGVETVLNMLEKGAFDALSRRWLKALQLTILEEPDHPEEVIESWTFSFQYTEPGENDNLKPTVSMQIGGGVQAPITVVNAKQALQKLLRTLLTDCTTLPELPDRRYLNMQLYYTDDCDESYEPPGFKPVLDLKQLWPLHDIWTFKTLHHGPAALGHHSVTLTSSYLIPLTRTGEQRIDLPKIPAGLKKSDPRWAHDGAPANSTTSQHDSEDVHNPRAPVLDLNDTESQALLARQATKTPDLYAPPTVEGGDGDGAQGLIKSQTIPDTQTSTQSREARRVHEGIQQIAQPSPVLDNLEETIPLNLQPSQAVTASQRKAEVRLQLSQAKIRELISRPPAKEATRRRGSVSKQRGPGAGMVDCQCGSEREEEYMASRDVRRKKSMADGAQVNCDFCGQWQHLVCYGYMDADDPRLPQPYACYRCLLEKREPEVYKRLTDFTFLRKVAKYVLSNGYTKDSELTFALHCHVQDAARVATRLKQEGYLVRSDGCRGQPKFKIAEDAQMREQFFATYFDPTFEIAHHLSLPEPMLEATAVETQFPLPPDDSQPDSGSPFAQLSPERMTEDTLWLHGLEAQSGSQRSYNIRGLKQSTIPIGQSVENFRQPTAKRRSEDEAEHASLRTLKRPRSSCGLSQIYIGPRSESPSSLN